MQAEGFGTCGDLSLSERTPAQAIVMAETGTGTVLCLGVGLIQ